VNATRLRSANPATQSPAVADPFFVFRRVLHCIPRSHTTLRWFSLTTSHSVRARQCNATGAWPHAHARKTNCRRSWTRPAQPTIRLVLAGASVNRNEKTNTHSRTYFPDTRQTDGQACIHTHADRDTELVVVTLFSCRPDLTKANQTKPNQTKPNQTKPNQTKPNQTKPYLFCSALLCPALPCPALPCSANLSGRVTVGMVRA